MVWLKHSPHKILDPLCRDVIYVRPSCESVSGLIINVIAVVVVVALILLFLLSDFPLGFVCKFQIFKLELVRHAQAPRLRLYRGDPLRFRHMLGNA